MTVFNFISLIGGLALFNGDDAVLADLLHGLGNQLAEVQHVDTVRNVHDQIHVVLDEENGQVEIFLDLADEAADPSIILEKAFSRAEFKRKFHERWKRLTKEQQRLVIRKANGETNVSIDAEQGVSEAAIRNQLKRIQKRFMDIH